MVSRTGLIAFIVAGCFSAPCAAELRVRIDPHSGHSLDVQECRINLVGASFGLPPEIYDPHRAGSPGYNEWQARAAISVLNRHLRPEERIEIGVWLKASLDRMSGAMSPKATLLRQIFREVSESLEENRRFPAEAIEGNQLCFDRVEPLDESGEMLGLQCSLEALGMLRPAD